MGARFLRSLAAGAAVLISAFALGQGSASGYGSLGSDAIGGGGFGGGQPGGSYMGSGNYSDEGGSSAQGRRAFPTILSAPEVESDNRLWMQKSAILTAGDKVETKFELKANDVLLASAEGESFDAALSVTDSTGLVLVKNDDRVEGNQTPFVMFRAVKDGTYSLNVLSYRSSGGGRFLAKYRVLHATDGEFGHKTYPVVEMNRRVNRFPLRFRLTKGQFVDVYQGIGTLGTVQKVFGPTGVPDSDFEIIQSRHYGPIILAKATGDYYFDFACYDSLLSQASMAHVPVTEGTPTFAQSLDFEPRQVRIIEFPVKKGGLVWTTLAGATLTSTVSSPELADQRAAGDSTTWNTNASYTEWKAKFGSDDDVVRIFKADGTARLVIRNSENTKRTVKIQNRDSIPEWQDGIASQEKMGIGEVRLFKMSSAKSQLMRVSVQASGFVPRLDIFSTMGVLANSLSDRDNLRAADDLYFPNAGEWIIRVTCTGFGGSGPFTMRRDLPKTVPYALGANLPIKLDGNNFGLFEVNLEKGKRYELLTNQGDRRFSVDVLNDEGEFLRPQTIRFDGLRAGYFVPERSGRHRLWIRGEPGEFATRLSLHKPPTVP